MDLSSQKVTDKDKLDLCKRYFFIGFALLPFLWAVNACWFFREAFLRKPAFPEQKQMQKLVLASGAGAVVCSALLVAWTATFVGHRAEWGAFADALSFNVPTGSP